MTQLLFANNAGSTLAASISATSTTAVLAAGTGSLFPNPGAGQGFKLTFAPAAGGAANEIVLVTGRSGDAITSMARGQEGTTAQAWNANDTARSLITAGVLSSFGQGSQASNFAVDTGTANALVVALPVAPASLASLVGVPIYVQKGTAANSGSITLAINTLSALPVVHADTSNLVNGEWPANGIGVVILEESQAAYQLVSIFSVPALLNEFTSDVASSGWIKRPDGIIEQWGTGTTISGSTAVVFPLTFPTAAIPGSGIVGVTGNAPAAGNSAYFDPASVTNTGMNVYSSTGTNIGFTYRILGR